MLTIYNDILLKKIGNKNLKKIENEMIIQPVALNHF